MARDMNASSPQNKNNKHGGVDGLGHVHKCLLIYDTINGTHHHLALERQEKDRDRLLSRASKERTRKYKNNEHAGTKRSSVDVGGVVPDDVWEDVAHYLIDSGAYDAFVQLCRESSDARRVMAAEYEDVAHPRPDRVEYDDLKSDVFRKRGKDLMEAFRERLRDNDDDVHYNKKRLIWFFDDGFCAAGLRINVERVMADELRHRGRVITITYDDYVRNRAVLRPGLAGVLVVGVRDLGDADPGFAKLEKFVIKDKRQKGKDEDDVDAKTIKVFLSPTDQVPSISNTFLKQPMREVFHVHANGEHTALGFVEHESLGSDADSQEHAQALTDYMTEEMGVEVESFGSGLGSVGGIMDAIKGMGSAMLAGHPMAGPIRSMMGMN